MEKKETIVSRRFRSEKQEFLSSAPLDLSMGYYLRLATCTLALALLSASAEGVSEAIFGLTIYSARTKFNAPRFTDDPGGSPMALAMSGGSGAPRPIAGLPGLRR